MITLQRPDPRISALIGNKNEIKKGDMVHPSQFAIPFTLDDRKVIYNSLTCQCIETRYLDWFENPIERAFDPSDAEMSALVKRDYLVLSDVNEVTRYTQLLKAIRGMERTKQGYTGYTIVPTTACNARCFYCYEAGISYETMTDEVVEQTIRYILDTRCENTPVQLDWFGGEPLIGEAIIDRICAAIREADVPYKSVMISNGSLMTEEMAEKARKDWNLFNVQITLDGREEVYCERKNYINFQGSPYRAVMDAIHALIKHRISVNVRLNVDEDNADDLMELVDELEEEFRSEKGIQVYCHSVFVDSSEESPEGSTLLYEKIDLLNQRIIVFNSNHKIQNKVGLFYDCCGTFRRYFCKVDTPKSGGVILPSGDICLCEQLVSVPVVGTVYDEGIADREQFIERGREKVKACAKCPMLPACTDFTSCPNCARNCVEEKKAKAKSGFQSIVYEKRLPPITIDIDDEIICIVEPTPEFAERCTPILTDDYRKVNATMPMEDAIEKYHL